MEFPGDDAGLAQKKDALRWRASVKLAWVQRIRWPGSLRDEAEVSRGLDVVQIDADRPGLADGDR